MAGPVSAELGGNGASVRTDQSKLQATLSSSDAGPYTLHTLQTATGTQVREYVSRAGTVFAVAWDGPQMPDLQQLLGSYFERYTTLAQQRAGRGPLTIAEADFVAQSGGHMRSFSGRAYLPDQVPADVAIATIQ